MKEMYLSLYLLLIIILIFFGLAYWNLKLEWIHPAEAARQVKCHCLSILDHLGWTDDMLTNIELEPREICNCQGPCDIGFYTRIAMTEIVGCWMDGRLDGDQIDFNRVWLQVIIAAEELGIPIDEMP